MARDHARIGVEIWDDKDFVALRADAQHVYFMLLSSKDLSWCGVADYVPARFTRLAKDMAARKFEAALNVLRGERFVLIDDGTAEILVRTYVRHDGLLKQPNVSKAMVKALHRTHSDELKGAVIDELIRAKQEQPEAKGWKGVEAEDAELYAHICLKASLNPFENPSGNPSGKDSAHA